MSWSRSKKLLDRIAEVDNTKIALICTVTPRGSTNARNLSEIIKKELDELNHVDHVDLEFDYNKGISRFQIMPESGQIDIVKQNVGDTLAELRDDQSLAFDWSFQESEIVSPHEAMMTDRERAAISAKSSKGNAKELGYGDQSEPKEPARDVAQKRWEPREPERNSRKEFTGFGTGKPKTPQDDPFSWSYGSGKSDAQAALQDAQKDQKPVEIHTSSDLISHDDYMRFIPKGSTINFYSQQTLAKNPFSKSMNHLSDMKFPSDSRLEKAGSRLRQAGFKVIYHGFKNKEMAK